MSEDHAVAPGAQRAPGRRLRVGTPLLGLLALAGTGFVSGCSQADTAPLHPPHASAAEESTDREDVDTGRQVFQEQCSICHAVTADTPKLGPDLEGVLRRGRLQTGRPATEPVVRELILEGSGAMRAFRDSLTDRQLDDLIAYLKTL